MKNSRRGFLEKLGVFSALCLTGTHEAISEVTSFQETTGMILKADEGEVRYIGNTRKAKVHIKVSKTSSYNPKMSLLSEVIIPGDGIPIHKHLNEEEFLFVHKGTVEITLGDLVQQGNPGDLIYVPKGVWHGFKNKSTEDVTMFFGYSPAGFEDYFRAIGTTNINDELGFTPEDWIRTNEKFGVVYK